MNDLKDILDMLFLEIVNETTTPKKIKAILDEMTLSYREVADMVAPFLERLEETGMGALKLGSFSFFLFTSEIIQVFLEKYFNQVQENGYYKNTKLLYDKNWYCSACNKFFDIPYEMRNKKFNEITCIHCNSDHWHNSKILKKSLHDFALN
jgi:hypothetical protein